MLLTDIYIATVLDMKELAAIAWINIATAYKDKRDDLSKINSRKFSFFFSFEI